MIIAMPEEVLERILKKVVDLGYRKKEIADGVHPGYISMNEAHKRYGRITVEGWVNAGIVKRHKDGKNKNSRIRVSVLELEMAACSNNLYTDLSEIAKVDVDEINNVRMTQFKDIKL